MDDTQIINEPFLYGMSMASIPYGDDTERVSMIESMWSRLKICTSTAGCKLLNNAAVSEDVKIVSKYHSIHPHSP